MVEAALAENHSQRNPNIPASGPQPSKRVLHNHKQGGRQNVLLALRGEARAASEEEGNPSSGVGIPNPQEANPNPEEGNPNPQEANPKLDP
jgi:hypothetical protein